jgi:ABC-type multidrug transport system permease subunit
VVPVAVKGQTRLVFVFLIVSVISSLLVFCVSNFTPHWWYSVYLVLLYVTFVVMCVLEEVQVIDI